MAFYPWLRRGTAVLAVLCATGGAAAPTANADPIADVQSRIAEIEQTSVVAASRAALSGQELATSQERLALFNRHVVRTEAELAKEQDSLAQLARQLYVNGGVDNAVLNFALDDPDEFIADLDRLAVSGTRQNTIVERARERAASLKSAQSAAEREQSRLTAAVASHQRDQAAADEALAAARRELADLEAEQRRAQSAAQAAIAAAIVEAEQLAEQWRLIAATAVSTSAQASAALAAGASFPSTTGGASAGTPGVEDLSRYGDSASWASSAKSQAVIMCESSGDYRINTGNGYYGAWQFDYPSWHGNGGGVFAEYPHQATKAQQDYVAWTYWLKAGWRPWECG